MGLAGSGASPRGLSLETVRGRARNGALPPLGAVTVSVPGAVSVIGFDDIEWVAHLPTPLTTVRQPLRELGSLDALTTLRRNRVGRGLAEPGNAAHRLLKHPWRSGPFIDLCHFTQLRQGAFHTRQQGGRGALAFCGFAALVLLVPRVLRLVETKALPA